MIRTCVHFYIVPMGSGAWWMETSENGENVAGIPPVKNWWSVHNRYITGSWHKLPWRGRGQVHASAGCLFSAPYVPQNGAMYHFWTILCTLLCLGTNAFSIGYVPAIQSTSMHFLGMLLMHCLCTTLCTNTICRCFLPGRNPSFASLILTSLI